MLSDALRRGGYLDGHDFTVLATDDGFVTQAQGESILRTAGVDATAMEAEITALLNK